MQDNPHPFVPSMEEWQSTEDLIARMLDNDSEAADELCDATLQPLVASSTTYCPERLSKRFFREACNALTQFIQSANNAPTQIDWVNAAQRIGHNLLSRLNEAGWDWLRVVLVLNGSVTAEDELLRKYMPYTARLANIFSGTYPEIVDDLAQVGQIWLRDKVLIEYKPEMGFTLWEFARKVLWRKMRDECRIWAKEHIAEPVYRRVTRAQNNLLKQLGREPTLEEVVRASGAAESDVQHVLKFGHSRRETTLDTSWNEGSEPGASYIEDWGTNPTHPVLQRAGYEEISRKLDDNCAPASNAQEGTRWLILFALHAQEQYSWDEIADILAGNQHANWASIHQVYFLPDSVPTNLAQVVRIFSVGPTLTGDNLKRWYSRRSSYLAGSLNRQDL